MQKFLFDIEALRALADQPNAWDGHGRADQLDSMREAIRDAADRLEYAPHGWACPQMGDPLDIDYVSDEECTCWKDGL